jgi:hypothetical protein
MRVPVGTVLSAVALLGAAVRADAQTITGRVVDSATEAGIPEATVEALRDREVIGRTVTDADGSFELQVRGSGAYVLRASALGYPALESDALEVRSRELVEVTLRISPAPLPLDGITVDARRTDLRHAATYEGLYARRETALPVGSTRVVLRNDHEMVNSMQVEDVLLWMRTPRRCVHWYVNGEPVVTPDKEWLYELSAQMLEGIEFYRDGFLAPYDYWGGDCGPMPSPQYSVIALWYRRPDPRNGGQDPAD